MSDPPRPGDGARPRPGMPADAAAQLLATSRGDFCAARHAQDDFIARGLRAADQARRSGHYISAHAMLRQLSDALADACRPARP